MKLIEENKQKSLAKLAVQYKTYDSLKAPCAIIALTVISIIVGTFVLIDLPRFYKFIRRKYQRYQAYRRRNRIADIEMANERARVNEVKLEIQNRSLPKKRPQYRKSLRNIETDFYKALLIAKQRGTLRSSVSNASKKANSRVLSRNSLDKRMKSKSSQKDKFNPTNIKQIDSKLSAIPSVPKGIRSNINNCTERYRMTKEDLEMFRRPVKFNRNNRLIKS